MRIAPLFSLAIITLMAAASVSALAQSSTSAKKTPGYMDELGIFHAVANTTNTSNTTDYSGTVVVTIKVTVKSTALASKPITCQGSLVAQSTSNGAGGFQAISFIETGSATSTTTTCVVKIPYSWLLFTPGSGIQTTIMGNYIVSINNATGMPLRLSEGPIVIGSVPSVGATTDVTINSTL